MRHLWLLTGLLAAPASAQTGQGDVAVTVYNNDLALVQDNRQLALPAGRSRQEFADVSAQIRPETVTLNGEGIGIVEQNFDFDLLSPGKLMEKRSGGRSRSPPPILPPVRDPERAIVLAVNGGVVLRIATGSKCFAMTACGSRDLRRDSRKSAARPTRSVTLESPRSGTRPVTLSYLTSGMS